MDRQKWLSERKIGSSDAATILKLFPFGKTPFMLWEEKVFGVERKDNPAMKRGRELEDKALASFEEKMGFMMLPQVCLTSKDHGFMTATLDGINISERVIVEVKCPKKEHHELALKGKVPDIYYPQLQHQLAVAGYPYMYYYSFDGNDGVAVEVARDESFILNMIEEERAFYQRVIDIVPPELCEKDIVSLEDNESWHVVAMRWREMHEKRKAAEEEEDTLRGELIRLADNRNVAGAGVKLTRSFCKGTVDYKAVPELKAVDLELYRKNPIEKWRISAMV